MKCYLSGYGRPRSTAVGGMTCIILVRMVTQNLDDDNLNVNNIKTEA